MRQLFSYISITQILGIKLPGNLYFRLVVKTLTVTFTQRFKWKTVSVAALLNVKYATQIWVTFSHRFIYFSVDQYEYIHLS